MADILNLYNTYVYLHNKIEKKYENSVHKLTNISHSFFNTIFTKSIFPHEWKQSKNIPITKTNKEFSPVAFYPFLSKLWKINQYLECNYFWSDRQSAIMEGRSCPTAL